MNFQPYNEQTASTQDRIAWTLCQIIDDDAPLRWTRYRFAAECIARNKSLMADFMKLGEQGPSWPHGLATQPAQAQALTDEQIASIVREARSTWRADGTTSERIARAVERAVREVKP